MLVGCSASTPQAPDAAAPPAPPRTLTIPEGTALTGTFELRIDRTAGEPTAHLEPARLVNAIGDHYHEVELTSAMDGDVCECFRVSALQLLDPETVRVTFDVRHPFDPLLRPDLHAFNLKAHIESSPNATIEGLPFNVDLVRNPDGYSRLMSTLHGTEEWALPFVVFTEDRGSDPFDYLNPSGWNVFATGATYTPHIDFRIPDGTTVGLRIYLTVDYGQSAVRATRDAPVYTLPEFAGFAPWRVQVVETSNTLREGDPASAASWDVTVYDWGHGLGIGTDVPEAFASISALGRTSPRPTTFTGSGREPDPLVGTFSETNEFGASAGDYWGLIAVHDAMGAGTGIADDLVTPFAVSFYWTWQVFPVHVEGASSLPPTAVIARPLCADSTVVTGRGVLLDGSGSTDDLTPPEALLYEWDLDYDGATFDVDVTGSPVRGTFAAAGAKTLALRVTDGSAQSAIATLAVNVIDPALHSPLQVTSSPSMESFEMGFTWDGGRCFVDSRGEVHLVYASNGFGSETMLHHIGDSCAGTTELVEPLPGIRIPDGTQVGDLVHFIAWTADHQDAQYLRLNLLTREMEVNELAIDSGPLPTGGGIGDAVLGVHPDTGDLVAVMENAAFDLYASEKPSGGSWSTPGLVYDRIGQIGAGSIAANMGVVFAGSELVVAFMDVDPTFFSRVSLFSRKPFGSGAWETAEMGFPNGEPYAFSLKRAPDGIDLIGTYGENGPNWVYYLRYDAESQIWSRARIGTLMTNFMAQTVLDADGIVTVIWQEGFLGEGNVRAKRFAWDADDATIGDATLIDVATTGITEEDPVLGLDWMTGNLCFAWEQESVSDLFSARY